MKRRRALGVAEHKQTAKKICKKNVGPSGTVRVVGRRTRGRRPIQKSAT